MMVPSKEDTAMISTTPQCPWLYRSEAFFEDIDDLVAPVLLAPRAATRGSRKPESGRAAWTELVRAVDAVVRSVSVGRQGA